MSHSADFYSQESTMALQSIRASKHAVERMHTRGVSEKDIDCLLKYGSQTKNGYLIKKKDAQAAITNLKREITRIERLASKQVLIIVKEDTLVTIYPATRKQFRREFKH